MLNLLFLILLSGEPTAYRVKVAPFDLQADKSGFAFMKRISQLETNGSQLFIRGKDATIRVVDRQGKVVSVLGNKGGGPGELGDRVFAMAVKGKSVWAIDQRIKKANYYENGKFMIDIPLKGYSVNRFSGSSRRFAFTNDHVIVPIHPKTGHLAAVYDYNGDVVKRIGAIFPINETELAVNPALNDTLWAINGDLVFGLFMNHPTLIQLDQDFDEVKRFSIIGPEIDEIDLSYAAHEPQRGRFPPPFFTDMQIYKGKVYLLCGGVLYQFDPTSGRTLSRTIFFGDLPEFGEIAGQKLGFIHFAIRDDGSIILGHPLMLWEHDMWQAKLPDSITLTHTN